MVLFAPSTIVVIEENGQKGFAKVQYNASLPVSGETSDWALDLVRTAIVDGLVPTHLQSMFQLEITRTDFATLSVYALKFLGKTVEELVLEKTGVTLQE